MKYRLYALAFLVVAAAALFGADLDRGIELYNKASYADAETELRAFVADNADNARGHLYLGYALLEQGKTPDAETELKKADEIQSSGETKLGLAYLAVQKKDWAKAESLIGGAKGDNLEFVRGQIHLQRQRYTDAARDMETALTIQPARAYAHYYAGMAYNGMKKPDKMLTHFELFLKMKPDAPEARKVRAVVSTGK